MKRSLLMPALFLTFAGTAFCQINTDSLFQSSISKSRNGNYDASVADARKVLGILPDRADVMVHIANVFAWKAQFDSSKIYINKAYRISPASNELYDSWLNILLWNREYDELHRVAGIAESNQYSNKANLALKRLIAWKETGNYTAAIGFAGVLDAETRNTPGIKAVYNELYSLASHNAITAFYSVDFFRKNDPGPQSFAFLDYSFRVSKHTIVLRQNFSGRSGLNDFLTEAEYYHKFRNSTYLYFNYGAGYKREIFPAHRAGFEIFFPLGNLADASAGGRLLRYEAGNIFILTGHIEKYISGSWISLRPFYVIRDNGNAFSLVGSYRIYERNPANYWGIEASYGNSPDDRYVISNMPGFFRLNAYRIRAEKNIALNVRNELKLSFGFSDEEYTENAFRNRYVAEILVKHRF